MLTKNKQPSSRKRLPNPNVINYLSFLVFLLFLVLVWYYFNHHSHARVHSVVVVGNFKQLDQNKLKKMIEPFTKTTFQQVDIHKLQETLALQTWVYDTEVKRIWPHTLFVKVIEQQPLAIWVALNGDNSEVKLSKKMNQKPTFCVKKTDTVTLLNSHNELFSVPCQVFSIDLPILSGIPGAQTEVWEQYQSLEKQLQPLNVLVQSLTLTPRHAWYLYLKTDTELVLGRTAIEKRLQRFVQAYPVLFKDRLSNAERIDLRYANGIAVKWR